MVGLLGERGTMFSGLIQDHERKLAEAEQAQGLLPPPPPYAPPPRLPALPALPTLLAPPVHPSILLLTWARPEQRGGGGQRGRRGQRCAMSSQAR